jgi:hypothetical protein
MQGVFRIARAGKVITDRRQVKVVPAVKNAEILNCQVK